MSGNIMSSSFTPLTEDLFQYLMDVSSREPLLLEKLRKETAELPDYRMQINPLQGQLMSLLISLMGAKKALEIGVFTGYSSTCVAVALPEDGKLVACDVSEEWTSVARRYWEEAGVDHKVDLRLGPALETLDALLWEGEAGTFDFAFIDADKVNYNAYFERSLSLLRTGGLIVVDNVLWGGGVIDKKDVTESTKAIREFNKNRTHDRRIDLSVLPIGDGLTFALKKE